VADVKIDSWSILEIRNNSLYVIIWHSLKPTRLLSLYSLSLTLRCYGDTKSFKDVVNNLLICFAIIFASHLYEL